MTMMILMMAMMMTMVITMMAMKKMMVKATTWCPGAASGLTAALSSPANAELLQPSPYHS